MAHDTGERLPMNNSQTAVDVAIAQIEVGLQSVMRLQDHITLPQYRRLKKARHALADFLVAALKTDADAKPAGDA